MYGLVGDPIVHPVDPQQTPLQVKVFKPTGQNTGDVTEEAADLMMQRYYREIRNLAYVDWYGIPNVPVLVATVDRLEAFQELGLSYPIVRAGWTLVSLFFDASPSVSVVDHYGEDARYILD
jgi:hypothetical protein